MIVSVVTVETLDRVTVVDVPGILIVTTISDGVGVKLIVVTGMVRVVMTSKLGDEPVGNISLNSQHFYV